MAGLAITSGASRVVSYGASDNLDTHFDNWADDHDGMSPVARPVAGVDTYVKPEHIHQALLHQLGYPTDTIDLRVEADTAILSS